MGHSVTYCYHACPTLIVSNFAIKSRFKFNYVLFHFAASDVAKSTAEGNHRPPAKHHLGDQHHAGHETAVKGGSIWWFWRISLAYAHLAPCLGKPLEVFYFKPLREVFYFFAFINGFRISMSLAFAEHEILFSKSMLFQSLWLKSGDIRMQFLRPPLSPF